MSPRTEQLRRLPHAFIFLLLFSGVAQTCAAQIQRPLCNQGSNGFQATFRTGVGVKVESAKNEGLSSRECRATLQWGSQNLVVADNAAQIDLDLFGVDL